MDKFSKNFPQNKSVPKALTLDTIADIALFPWLRIHKHLGLSLENAENLSRWHEAILARPATEEALTFFDGISS